MSGGLPLSTDGNGGSVFFAWSEEQNNLMKALMIPAQDTPYAHGCFEFNILIPDAYPDEPPKVLLATTGGGKFRFNPNLYNCGKVCLSLLGTWPGEPWDAKVSNLLQVGKRERERARGRDHGCRGGVSPSGVVHRPRRHCHACES